MTRASAVASYLSELFGQQPPVRVRMWDGSEAGAPGGATVVLRRPDALRYLLWSPGQLGLARAYVTGALDVEGDLEEGLATVLAGVEGARPRLTPRALAGGLGLLRELGALGRPAPAPRSEMRPRGQRHSPQRDAQVISHHYDLSNRFYSLILDPSMAYSCAYWTSDDPGYTVADAQRDKLDLICRKLDLRPGTRLLDVGCGWGSLTVHAAREYGAEVTAVTVSKEQRAFVAERVRRAGIADLVNLRLCDYREVLGESGDGFDAVAAIEMGEHVGDAQYPSFLRGLHSRLREGGRFLLQVMSRGSRDPGGGPFIERYIAADMHMRPLHETLAQMARAGFEVRDVHALREHYVRTIRAWRAEMESRWDEVEGLLGQEGARVWRIYLAGSALAFERNRMGVDQILAVRTRTEGASGMERTRLRWDSPGSRAGGRPLSAVG